MSPELLRRLASADGQSLLAALGRYDPAQTLAVAERLRALGWDSDLVAAAMTQQRLRARAEADLGPQAETMLFTDAGLQQATRWVVACRRAAQFVEAGASMVADLGCGIGVDARAMAAAGLRVAAVERDPVTAAVAAANLRPWPTARMLIGDATQLYDPVDGPTSCALAGVDAAFVDPARRTQDGRRVFDPRRAEPPLSYIEAIATRLPVVAAKVAPGIDHDLVPAAAQAQWVSVEGKLVEACLWFGESAPMLHAASEPPQRFSAVVLSRRQPASVDAPPSGAELGEPTALAEAGWHAYELAGDLGHTPDAGTLGNYLVEPDDAVIRAAGLGPLASALDARLIDPTIAYLTSDRPGPASPLYRRHRVLEAMPFSLKRLRSHLRQLDVGVLAIKKRGTAVEPEGLRRQLRLSGAAEATVVLTRVAGQQMAIMVEPLGH